MESMKETDYKDFPIESFEVEHRDDSLETQKILERILKEDPRMAESLAKYLDITKCTAQGPMIARMAEGTEKEWDIESLKRTLYQDAGGNFVVRGFSINKFGDLSYFIRYKHAENNEEKVLTRSARAFEIVRPHICNSFKVYYSREDGFLYVLPEKDWGHERKPMTI